MSTAMNRLTKILVEKGGIKKKDLIKFYKPDLILKSKKTKDAPERPVLNFEVSEIDMSDSENIRFNLFRFDVDGRRVDLRNIPAEVILRDYEIA